MENLDLGDKMGRHLDLGHLSEEECERILQVIQRDFDLRQKEKGRLGKIDEDMKEEDTKVLILAKEKKFNENCCMRCFSRFFFIFNQKVQCSVCDYFVCKDCSSYHSDEKQYICNVCIKQRQFQTQSCDWFYSNIKRKFKRFGSAKVVRSLYKRKTELNRRRAADSENDSGYDPSQYSNSLPVGRRSRQTIEGFFMGLNKPLNSTDSCADAAAPQTFEAVKEQEVQRFETDLNDIINDFHRTLENQTPEGLPNGDPSGGYERLLEAERSRITNSLSNLSQNLHLAIHNRTPNTDELDSTARQQAVHETVIGEVEKYVGHAVDLDEEKRLQYGTTTDNQGAYEEVLADAIIAKILDDHKKVDDQHHLREEERVRKDLTKLSNQCTITQLTDLLSTDTETDEAQTSIGTDDEGRLSECRDTDTDSVRSASIAATFTHREQITESTDEKGQTYDTGQDSDSDLDDLVALNAESADELHRARRLTASPLIKEDAVRMSVSSLESSDMTITVTSPTGETFLAMSDNDENDFGENDMENDLNKNGEVFEKVSMTNAQLLTHGRNISEKGTSGSESDATLEAEEDIVTLEGDAALVNGSPPDAKLFMFAMDRMVPLPSFEDNDSNIGIDEIDLDDISRHGDDDDSSNNTMTFDSEISFGQSWDVSHPGPLFKDRISAYDNFGERKVGKDHQGPVFMLVPDGSVQSPRVGEKDLDELSDLSENSSKSDISFDSDDFSEDEDQVDNVISERKERGKKSSPRQMSDFAVQTDDLLFTQGSLVDIRASSQVNIEHEDVMMISTMSTRDQLLTKKLEDDDNDEEEEEDAEDMDPRFVMRPKTLSTPLGEVARFVCQVDGTKPLDVFWYREGAQVQQLEDDEKYDVHSRDDRHTLEIFNTSPDDRGRYFCIAINEKGQNHKRFKLRLSDNKSVTAAPEFLKPIQDVELMEKMSVTFRCKLQGYPQPRVLWYKDGKVLRNNEHVRIQKQGNRDYVLSIEYVTMDDDAEYMVVAKNIAGEAKSSAQLLVEEKTDETSRKYADQEEAASLSSMSSSKTNYPETEELLKIANQAYTTRTRATGSTADNNLQTANKICYDDLDLGMKRSVIDDDITPVDWNSLLLSSIHSQIDEMDRKLDHLEDDVHDSMLSPDFDSVISESDTTNNNSRNSRLDNSSTTYQPINNSLREAILREHQEMRTTARSLRRVTNTTLEVLTSTNALLQADVPNLNLSNPPPLSQGQDLSDQSVDTSSASLLITKPSSGPEDDEQVEDLHLVFADFELLYQHGKVTKEQLKSGKVSRKDGQRLLADLQELKRNSVTESMERSHELSADNLTTSIDCGLKRVPSKRYKRDYVINRSPQVSRKKWDVKSPTPVGTEIVQATPAGAHEQDLLNDAEESVYISACKVFTLEERIKQLEGGLEQEDLSDEQLNALEDQVARTVAQVTQSDVQVANLERNVGELRQSFSGEEPSRTGSQSKSFDLSMSQSPLERSVYPGYTEESSYHGDMSMTGQPDLPSVKNLRSMFAEDDGSSVKRVHSLTGRDLPRSVREKLREQAPDVVQSSNVRLQEDPHRRAQLRMMLEDSATHEYTMEDEASRAEDTQPRSSTPFGTPVVNVSLEHSRVSVGSTPSPKGLSGSYAATTRSVKRTAPSPVKANQQAKSASYAEDLNLPAEDKSTGHIADNPQGATASGSTLPAPVKGRRSAIMARAAFWDDRILQGKASDKELDKQEFPGLPENSFKSLDQL